MHHTQPTTGMLIHWTSIKFSNDGLSLLVTTDGDYHYILDAFTGVIKRRLSGHKAGFTPDGQYVVGGKYQYYWCFAV
jgi:COMPASS component SWD2